MGHLGQDPDVKVFDNNRKLARISLATNEIYKNEKGEKITETQWHNLVFWGPQAEIAEKYLQKGKEVAVEGRLVTRNFTDREGKNHFITEIVVSELLMITKKDRTT